MTIFEKLAYRIRPDLKERNAIDRAGQVLNMMLGALIIPFGSLSLIWLYLATDWDVIFRNAGLLFVLFLLGFLFRKYPFELQLELRPGAIATSGGDLFFVAAVSAVLIFGRSVYWLGVLLPLLHSIWAIRRETQPDRKWTEMATLSASLSTGVPAVFASLWAYEQLGGQVPLQALSVQTILPGMAFLLIYALAPFVILAPVLVYLLMNSQLLNGDSPGSQRDLLVFVFVNSLIPNLASPFAFLAAAIYAQSGVVFYLFFLAGILLASMLANNLTNSVNERDQRARELAVLEALGREIIAADPGETDLSALIARYLPGMFYRSRIFIRLDPDRVLYQSEQVNLPAPEEIEKFLPEDGHHFRKIPASSLALDPARECVVFAVVQDDGQKLGWIYFDHRAELGPIEKYFPALQSLSAQIASAVYRANAYREALVKQRMQNELELAGRIQANFLPERIPVLPGYEIAASLDPALQTSGDFYDFIPLSQGRLGLIVADVADKGTGAALFMALTRTLLRTYAAMHPDDPAASFRLVNERVHEDTQSQLFITTFMAIIDPVHHTLTYVNGGHNPPFLWVPGDKESFRELSRTGIPIGMFKNGNWAAQKIPFPDDGILMMYTDGVTEAQNAEGEFFEEERLRDLLWDHSDPPVSDLHSRILDTIRAFVGQAPQFDDITLVIVKRQISEEVS